MGAYVYDAKIFGKRERVREREKERKSYTHASDMGSRFLAPYTELICSGSVSDFVTMSESLDQGVKG